MSPLLSLPIGFSIGMALLLALVLASAPAVRHAALPSQSRLCGYVMLATLCWTQWCHLRIAMSDDPVPLSRGYAFALFLQALAFHGLLSGVLRPAGSWRWREWALLAAGLAAGALVPLAWAVPLALALGAVLAVHLGTLVYRLRALRRQFRLELAVVAAFAGMAVVAAAAGLSAQSWLGWAGYAWTYAVLIALGLFLVAWLLLVVPDLVGKTQDAVVRSYAQSTLGRVDAEAKLAELRRLFDVERIHRDETLSLARLAELLDLTPHQLSELANTRLEVGFSKLVRRYRVEDARRMLLDEPKASVLSVGLAVGFASQSSFYVAFKEAFGVVPGRYRRQQGAPEPAE